MGEYIETWESREPSPEERVLLVLMGRPRPQLLRIWLHSPGSQPWTRYLAIEMGWGPLDTEKGPGGGGGGRGEGHDHTWRKGEGDG